MTAVDNSKFGRHFVKPLYESYCFSNIPNTIKQILTTSVDIALPEKSLKQKKAGKVIFLFIDSFGWQFWQKYHQRYPFLSRFLKKGVVSKLTSQFPSTTSAHVTTIHTGMPVGQSGLFEWYYYEPKVGAIIAPFLFSFAGDKTPNTLLPTGIKPKAIYPQKTFYQELSRNKIKSYIFQYRSYTPSAFSDTVYKAATEVFPYRSLAHGLSLITQTVLNTSAPAYYFYYYDFLDRACHMDGPNSLVHQAEVHNLFTALEDLFYQQIKKEKKLTILLSADHGIVKVNPQRTFYLNKKIKNFDHYLKTGDNKQLLTPAGSCRDMFIYAKDNMISQTKQLLQTALRNKAEVYETQELISQGFFGPKVTRQLLDRLSNLVILPYKDQAVWWYEKDKFEQRFFGHHGGLTSEEMEIPFLSL